MNSAPRRDRDDSGRAFLGRGNFLFIFRPYDVERPALPGALGREKKGAEAVLDSKILGERGRDFASILLVLAVPVALASSDLVALFEPYAFHALFFLVIFSLNLLGDRPERVIAKIDILSVKIVLWQLFAVPAVVVLFSFATQMPAEVRTILLISATASSVFASPALVHIIGLDTALATRTMVLSTLLMPVSLFVFGVVASALPLSLSIGDYLARTFVFLVTPLVISSIWRRVAERLAPRKQAALSTFSYWGSVASLIAFGIGVMAVLHDFVPSDLPLVLGYASVAILFGCVVFGISMTLFMRSGASQSTTAGIMSAVRNVGLSFAILGTAAGAEVALYVAVCQFPIFLMPMALRVLGNGALLPRSKRAS